MRCQAALLAVRPLTLRVELVNDGAAPLMVPRVLEPTGAFVAVVLRDHAGAEVARTHKPKFTPKLRPDDPAAYVTLAPGERHGVDLVLDEPGFAELGPGRYHADLTYSNLYYQGPHGELGTQTCATTVPVELAP